MITLATLPNATAQEVFDQVKTHLLTQNARSDNGRSAKGVLYQCLYRSANGLKCAAGSLIADSEYQEYFDDSSLKPELITNGSGWDSLIDAGIVPANHCDLIRRLQEVHDEYAPQDWTSELQSVARAYNLNY